MLASMDPERRIPVDGRVVVSRTRDGGAEIESLTAVITRRMD